MGERKALGNAVRFSVFERDGFKCQYCGSQPPSVVLQVDHVVPVSKGGGNELDNLVASCTNCNAGKFTRTLEGPAPADYAAKAEDAEVRAIQLNAYRAQLTRFREELQASVDFVGAAFWGEGLTWSKEDASDKRGRVSKFIDLIGLGEVSEAAEIAFSKFPEEMSDGTRFKYFCGICWRKAKGEQNA